MCSSLNTNYLDTPIVRKGTRKLVISESSSSDERSEEDVKGKKNIKLTTLTTLPPHHPYLVFGRAFPNRRSFSASSPQTCPVCE